MTLLSEWQPQSAVLITWPHAHSDWRDNLPVIEIEYQAFCRAITPFTPLIILCYDLEHQNHIQQQLTGVSNISTIICPTNDTWIRDYGPFSGYHGHFNGWGGKYEHDLDSKATSSLYQQGILGDTPLKPCDLIIEGGNLESDGQGSLITHWRCWQQRYPNITEAELSEKIKTNLDVKHIHFIYHGALEGDDTDCHIDNLVRFVNPSTLAYLDCDPQLTQQLKALRTPNNQAYELIPLPVPDAIYDKHGQRLPASTANFLISNQCVIMPSYDVATDRLALSILQTAFPKHTVIPVPARTLVSQFGSWHCASMSINY